MDSDGSCCKGGGSLDGDGNESIHDDTDIFDMCDSDSEPSTRVNDEASTSSSRALKFEMIGSTINIDNSNQIHFGLVVKSPPEPPTTLNSSCSSPSLSSRSDRVPHTNRSVSVNEMSSNCSQASFDSRRFSEMIPEHDTHPCSSIPHSCSSVSHSPHPFIQEHGPHPFVFSMPPPTPQAESSFFVDNLNNVLSSQAMNGDAPGSCSSATPVRKSVSQPVDSRRRFSSTSSNLENFHNPLTRSQALNPAATQQQTSAKIINSKDVHFGTKFECHHNYNIISPEGSKLYPLQSNRTIATSEPSKDYLLEFKEKLISVYQKRTMSSLLPWHRGKQLIPINEYYTEPQIFAVDNCGNRTSESVNIISILSSAHETRFLVEGEAGMGKTLLATKLAEEWAKGQHLQQFRILILVTLGDFKGSLQQYVREELLPSYFESEKFDRVWEYCKSHDREILFVLDGFDELQRRLDSGEIQNLLKSKDFPESKVVVTSRPNILLECWEKKIVVSGFGQLQIIEFIEKYFRTINNVSSGKSLRKILEKDDKYWKLAKRPLFCVLLCMLYITGDVGESLPDRQSDIMLQIILCLIKWNHKTNGNSAIELDSLPPEYEKPFFHFGKLCLNTLKTEKSRFTDQEVHSVEGFDSKLQQLGFLYNDNESHALGERKFWKPVHQTFLEYLGAFYMARHLKDCKGGCKECKSYHQVFMRSPEVLKFCVGILNNKAYRLLDGQRFPDLYKLSVTNILQLLKEAEPKPENCQAVAKLLDRETIEISTSEVEFEGWSFILSQPFKSLKNLRIAWRIKSTSPDQESSFVEASEVQYSNFFEALKLNESISEIHVRAKLDGEMFTDAKIGQFFSHFTAALCKKNLRILEVVELKMEASGHLKAALENVIKQSNKVRVLQDLRVLKLHTFMEDKDLGGICEALQKCAPVLEKLHISGLRHGNTGFQSLVKLLKWNQNITELHISMDQSELVNVLGSGIHSSKNYAPVEMGLEHKRMNATAGKKSKSAFADLSNGESEHGKNFLTVGERDCGGGRHSPIPSNSPSARRDIDPQKELRYLFDKLPLTNGSWSIEARHNWYLRKASCDQRVPLPICVEGEHKSVFHFLFSALPDTRIKSLTLSQAGLYLTTPDMICLGNAVRKSMYLTSLNVQGLEKVESYLPLLIGIGQSPALISVNISSSKVSFNDIAFEVACKALQNNTILQSIHLCRWHFHLQNSKEALNHISNLFDSWVVSTLNLEQCCIYLGNHFMSHSVAPPTPTSPCFPEPLQAFFSARSFELTRPWRPLNILCMEGLEVKEESGLVRRGHLLLIRLLNFVSLTVLDLSMPPGSSVRSLQVDSVALRQFFGHIGSHLKLLKELKMRNWEFCFQYSKENDLAPCLRSCKKLKIINLEGVNEIVEESTSNKNNSSCKLTFLHQLVSYIPCLDELHLRYYRINKSQIDSDYATKLGICLRDHFHHVPFKVKFHKLSTEVDNALFNSLNKTCKVKRQTGPLYRTYEVRHMLSLMKRPSS